MKNNFWKSKRDGWTIICDMDEWLSISEADIVNESAKGVTIIKTKGYDIIADSKSVNIDDINLHSLTRGVYHKNMSKHSCFNSEVISEMNYEIGAHANSPVGIVKYSDTEYIIKHMDFLGLPFKLSKNVARFERSHTMRSIGLDFHYITDPDYVGKELSKKLESTEDLSELLSKYMVN
jgi:hypothetical protein